MLPAWHKKRKKEYTGDKAVIFPPGNNCCVYVWVHVLNTQQSLPKLSNPCKLKQVTVYQEKAEKPCCTISSMAFHFLPFLLLFWMVTFYWALKTKKWHLEVCGNKNHTKSHITCISCNVTFFLTHSSSPFMTHLHHLKQLVTLLLKKKKALEFDLLRNVRLHHDILLPLNLPTPVNDTTTKCYFDNGSAWGGTDWYII